MKIRQRVHEKTVATAINHIKVRNAPGLSGIVFEMVLAAGDKIIASLTFYTNKIIKQRTIPSNWELHTF